ncbi:hypothetical protein [Aquirhabdus parva]|uniref:Uncharacterized protein n=1 Tax=Aquirhabdus parva TaxID=2283318 RepID=A0A345P706_9GAMM|nr:hypothetical protein [Aquirhabdus parva]AXI03065.1 hypothetical protein HYN46_09570 [Aquirhabdus parva]
MSNYVCSQLSAPDGNGISTCTVWAVDQPFLPDLTNDQANELLGPVVTMFCVVFAWKIVGKFMARK